MLANTGLIDAPTETSKQTFGLESPDNLIADSVHLDLWIREPELVSALIVHPEGRSRDDYARSALRVGVAALQHAQGRLDAETLKHEGQRLMNELEAKLNGYHGLLGSVLNTKLKEYFDPQDGRFSERVERLVKQDGDLERVMRAQISATSETLRKTLEDHLGNGSPFAQLLAPGESNQLLVGIRSAVDELITAQQRKMLAEFSLDNREGALSRLLAELSTTHGQLTGDIKQTMGELIGEFSLDREDSALSRLVKRVEEAQQRISAEFTLDSETSALSRMKRDLTIMIRDLQKETLEFQQSMIIALEAMKARKQETMASTRHGKDFEQAAYIFLEDLSQKAGDIAENTGDRPGMIKGCKVGDAVITLGPDCEAAGARIVCEMKEKNGYVLAQALEDLKTARDNRSAEVGLFIFSKKTAPTGLKPLARYGHDVVTVWDSDDEGTDVFLTASLMVCKALAVRSKTAQDRAAADFEAIERAIREIERQAEYLNEIETSSTTIKNGAEKILKRVTLMRTAFEKQMEVLDAETAAIRQLFIT